VQDISRAAVLAAVACVSQHAEGVASVGMPDAYSSLLSLRVSCVAVAKPLVRHACRGYQPLVQRVHVRNTLYVEVVGGLKVVHGPCGEEHLAVLVLKENVDVVHCV
jgi:hypothetical protein